MNLKQIRNADEVSTEGGKLDAYKPTETGFYVDFNISTFEKISEEHLKKSEKPTQSVHLAQS